MNKFENNKNTLFYEKSVKRYGVSAKGVQWNSKYTQYKRFEILTSFIQNIENSSLVDAGCGFGEYYNYLIKNNKSPKSYIGIDCEKMMIDLASKRFSNIDFKIQNIIKDELQISDYYICSGAMNILNFDEISIFIKKCFDASNVAFIFNFLKNDSLTNIKVDEILTYCRTLTKKIKIKEHYLENDVTIYLEK
ncbi:MAG: class I SAM-dependent methyltransferase [Arcobacter sp.]|uniref:class I SAM-dependent methyltransferase n=1 Tax=Arcobacter sp. TaxID=1872629 RepID=UPI00258C9E06|nr:class I SAM-dependent methyltransferase [Arcobacter sp.]MDD3007404.1 class I SAM-dependent methyltransferase [Arcobacter sp.]MDY3204546.1 class I SAM-dependent methyltransferase [Arcobacter sp.]